MKVLDRFTGRQLNALPSILMPGRYCLLDRGGCNGHPLQADDLLLDDGSGVIQVGEAEHLFSRIELLDQDEPNLTAEAIMTIADKMADGDLNISPMLPSEIAAQCELNELERSLAEVLERGHLQFISDRPRMDLRYDNWVVPVARARRLATSALTHLASHSDCWQQRTLSGILPRKILTRFSEDDYAIYENRLYKRLLDKLERRLSRRIKTIKDLIKKFEEVDNFQNFQDPEKTHFRLRYDICKLWGEVYQDDNTGTRLKSGKDTLGQLKKKWRTIRSLRQCEQGLYRQIPANAAVPTEIHRTNILNHDPHYRHLPPLWEMLQINQKDEQLTREQRLARQQKLQSAYSDYVGLVLTRALEERYELSIQGGQLTFTGASKKFLVKPDQLNWIIVSAQDEGQRLELIPIAWFGALPEDQQFTNSNRIICWPGHAASRMGSHSLWITPMDLWVVENMGRLIDQWLLRQLLKAYGSLLGPLPTPVKQLTDRWPEQFKSISHTHVQLIEPLDEEQISELGGLLEESASPQVIENINSAISTMDALSRLCDHEPRFEPNGPEGFYCRCETCQITWSLRTSGNKKFFSKRPDRASTIGADEGFTWAGRDWLDIEIDTGAAHG